eukprot:m.66093 g.66093  ORF g.66093 m.66093 type:complete len:258 (+) comp14032_c0_seq1:122-895(+)
MPPAAAVAPKKRGRIEFAFWANILALNAGFLLALGGILGLQVFPRHGIAIYSLVAGVVIFLIEWPRSRRKHGSSNEPREFQQLLSPIVEWFGLILSNYFVRSVIYFCASVPAFFQLAVIIGGVTLVLAALVYFLAALRNERWAAIPASLNVDERRPNISQAPTQPPPRLIKGSLGPAPTDAPPRPPEQSKSTKRKMPTELPPAPSDAPPRPPTRTLATGNVWQATLDPRTGQTYYYNIETRQVTWEKPESLYQSSRV